MGGTLEDYMLGALVFSLFLGCYAMFIGGMSGAYDLGSPEVGEGGDYRSAFLNKSESLTASIQDNIDEGGDSLFGVSGFLIPIKLLFETKDLVWAVVVDSFSSLRELGLPIPSLVDAVIYAAIGVFVGFAIYSVVVQRRA